MISHILLDLDGVIRLYDNTDLFALEQKHHLPKYTFFSFAFETHLLQQAVTGYISDEQWKEEVLRTFLAQYPHLPAEEFVRTLWQSSYTINQPLLALLRSHFPHAAFVLGTNATSRLQQDLQKAGIQDEFSRIYNSADMQCAKPDERFFTVIRDEIQVPFEQILYLDDSERNIEVGNILGINSFLYTGNIEAVSRWIEQHNF